MRAGCSKMPRHGNRGYSSSFRFTCKTWELRSGPDETRTRDLPCEGSMIMSWWFAGVQKNLQISILSLLPCRQCSQLFAWVGVRLVSTVT
jgi:hypothetical protein